MRVREARLCPMDSPCRHDYVHTFRAGNVKPVEPSTLGRGGAMKREIVSREVRKGGVVHEILIQRAIRKEGKLMV